MTRTAPFLLVLFAGLAWLVWAWPAMGAVTQVPMHCGPAQEVIGKLSAPPISEEVVDVAPGRLNMVTMENRQTGTWSIVLLAPSGQGACYVAGGQDEPSADADAGT